MIKTMSALRKFSQAELRKLIQERNSKIQKPKTVADKIESPLAKYDGAGNLQCIMCKVQVKPSVWKVHINSKQHKQKTQEAKKIVEKNTATQETKLGSGTSGVNISPILVTKPTIVTESKTRTCSDVGLNTNSASQKGNLKNEIIKLQLITDTGSIVRPSTSTILGLQTHETKTNATTSETVESVLPDKFFDDPPRDVNGQVNDATKDPLEDEWNRFQREIKEETSVSYKIVAGQQDEAAIEREIEEIDEQLKRWQKVVEFENKTATVLKNKVSANIKANTNSSESDDDNDDLDNESESFMEFSDWRAKKLKL